MDIQPIDKNTMLQIYKYGTYYSPASKHYGDDLANVVCDRCFKNNLDICIGWLTHDVCISCMKEINNGINNGINNKTINKKKVTPVNRGIARRMMQRQFRQK